MLAHLKRAEPHAEECRDATWTAPSFRLRLIDCWNALSKGMAGGWVDLPPSPDDYRCGAVDIDENDHCDCPLSGDMHEVVPGRFIAFLAMKHLGGDGDCDCYRTSAATTTATATATTGAAAAASSARTSTPASSPRTSGWRRRCCSTRRGTTGGAWMGLHDLEFEDCTATDSRLADSAAPGAPVAKHCEAGADGDADRGVAGAAARVRGAGGDRVAARHAAGVGHGEQQRFLCALEAAAAGRPGPRCLLPAPAGDAEGLVAQVAAGAVWRAAARFGAALRHRRRRKRKRRRGTRWMKSV